MLMQPSWREHLPVGLRSGLAVLGHPYALFLLVVLAVWLPRGFLIGDVNDGWIQLYMVMTRDVALRSTWSRMFGVLPAWTGYHLDPTGFIGIQFVMLVFAYLRATLFYEIIKRLVPELPAFAAAAGLLAAFHAADSGYFWLGASGLNFALVTALAACLCAVIYLQTNRSLALFGALAFQFLSGFTYSGFIPVMAALPVGAWLLRRMRGARPGALYLVKMLGMVTVVLIANAWLLKSGQGHDNVVADPNLGRALAGYVRAAHRLVDAWPFLLVAVSPWHLLLALLGAGFAVVGADAWTRREPAAVAALHWKWVAVFCAGCAGLALLAYLPYSISTVRFQPYRTLLFAGLFSYTAALLPLFLWLYRRKERWVVQTALSTMTALVLLAGLGGRNYWVNEYRAEERLLAALAKAVPAPAPGSYFLLRMQSPEQSKRIRGFTDRETAFMIALRYMYGQPDLGGGFYGFGDNRASFDTRGVHARKTNMMWPENAGADYAHLIALDYSPEDGSVTPIGKEELVKLTGLQTLVPYAPSTQPVVPPEGSRVCSMLEPSFRPDSCPR